MSRTYIRRDLEIKKVEWNEWGEWGQCSKWCGKGQQARIRTAKNQILRPDQVLPGKALSAKMPS